MSLKPDLMFRMLEAVMEFDRNTRMERTAEGRSAKRQRGGHTGGITPFGYTKVGTGRKAELVPDPAQQAALADIRKLAAEGLASRAIAAAVLERHGLAISHVTVNRIRSAGEVAA